MTIIVQPGSGRVTLQQVAGDVERYSFDLDDWLGGDMLQNSAIEAADAGIGLTQESPTVVLASSPSAGLYNASLSFTSASGRVRVVHLVFEVTGA